MYGAFCGSTGHNTERKKEIKKEIKKEKKERKKGETIFLASDTSSLHNTHSYKIA